MRIPYGGTFFAQFCIIMVVYCNGFESYAIADSARRKIEDVVQMTPGEHQMLGGLREIKKAQLLSKYKIWRVQS